MRNRHEHTYQRGFTLVEMTIVIGIIDTITVHNETVYRDGLPAPA